MREYTKRNISLKDKFMDKNLFCKKSLGIIGVSIITFATSVGLENITINCYQKESIINCENEKKNNDLSDHLTPKFEISDTSSVLGIGIKLKLNL